MLRDIAKNNVKLYNIDAAKLAEEVGLGKRINNIMTVAFYKLSGVLPFEQAEKMLRDDVKYLYGEKGKKK